MTLDPVHFEGIAQLAGRIQSGVDTSDHGEFAETVWAEFLDPLYKDGTPILEPLGEQRRRLIDIEDAALMDPRFPTQHGLDSGTINPTTFKNGLVIDVAQAAMASVPSDLGLHRARSVVSTVHSNDATVAVGEDEWSMFDRGYSRGRIMQAPRVDRYEQTVVHALALYLAESHHAALQAEMVDDLLILDGPIYPTGLLKWTDQDPTLADLLVEDERPRDVVQNYLDLSLERDLPPEDYEVTFFVVYDPREELLYRVEAPHAVTKDPDLREDLTMQMLTDVAAQGGPPLAVQKADELARISRGEKEALQQQLEETFETNRQREYDDVRWDEVE